MLDKDYKITMFAESRIAQYLDFFYRVWRENKFWRENKCWWTLFIRTLAGNLNVEVVEAEIINSTLENIKKLKNEKFG